MAETCFVPTANLCDIKAGLQGNCYPELSSTVLDSSCVQPTSVLADIGGAWVKKDWDKIRAKMKVSAFNALTIAPGTALPVVGTTLGVASVSITNTECYPVEVTSFFAIGQTDIRVPAGAKFALAYEFSLDGGATFTFYSRQTFWNPSGITQDLCFSTKDTTQAIATLAVGATYSIAMRVTVSPLLTGDTGTLGATWVSTGGGIVKLWYNQL